MINASLLIMDQHSLCDKLILTFDHKITVLLWLNFDDNHNNK